MKIIISPFSRVLKNGKRNPKNYPFWKEVIEGLPDHELIQIGIEGEEQLVPDFRKNLPIYVIKELLQGCDLFISVDSFLQHLAHSIGKKGIVLFSVSDPEIFGYAEHVNLIKDRAFLREEQFAFWEQCEYNENAFVSPDVVLNAVRDFKYPLVTIVTPLLVRQEFHQALAHMVKSQTYPNIEHLILEEQWSYDSKLSTVEAARYELIDVPEGELVSLGYKYRLANKIAKGNIIVRMDSDGFFGPKYVEKLVDLFLKSGKKCACIKNTYIYDLTSRKYDICNGSGLYIYYKDALKDEWFADDRDKAEDLALWENIRDTGNIGLFTDFDYLDDHICIRYFSFDEVYENRDKTRHMWGGGVYITTDEFAKRGGHLSAYRCNLRHDDQDLKFLSEKVKDQKLINLYSSFYKNVQT